MAAEKGRLFVLKIEDSPGSGTYTTVAGLRSTSFTGNNEIVDATTKDDAGWRKLLEGVSFKNAQISGQGMVQGSTNRQSLVNKWLNGTIDNYRIEFEDGDVMEGAFQLSSFNDEGPHDGVEQYSITLESSGPVTYTAA